MGEKPVAEGVSEPDGTFRCTLGPEWVGRELILVVREPGFVYDHTNPIRVEKWGLFFAVKMTRDLNYNGSKGARTQDPNAWDRWNSTDKHVQASALVQAEARAARRVWPALFAGLVVAILLGITGFFVSPWLALALGVAGVGAAELLTRLLSD